MASENLPPGWKHAKSKNPNHAGRRFYYNSKFKISVWEHPQHFERQPIDVKIKNTIVLRRENYNFCLDTNVLIHHLSFVEWVVDLCVELKRSYVNVPYKVWEELDGVHKYGNDGEVRECARKAMKKVEKWMTNKAPVFLESKSDFDKRKKDEEGLSNDEKIMNFCKSKLVSTRKKDRKPFFLTDDRNLRLRVMADHIRCSKPDFDEMLEALAISCGSEPPSVEGVSRELPSTTSAGSDGLSDDAMDFEEYQPPDPRTALPREILELFWEEGRKVLIWIIVQKLSLYFWNKFMPGDEAKLAEIMREELGAQHFNLLQSENISMMGVLKLWEFYEPALIENMDNWSLKEYKEHKGELTKYAENSSVCEELDLDNQSWVDNLVEIAGIYKNHERVNRFLCKVDEQFS